MLLESSKSDREDEGIEIDKIVNSEWHLRKKKTSDTDNKKEKL